jgi:hypothetical protein
VPVGVASPSATYDAFVSYSHAADGRLAPALQAGLQSLAKPWYRRRALRVFRDKTSLSASPELWPAIERALAQARYFVLLASPEAAGSHWVDREVRWWRAHRDRDTALIVLTDGQLVWDEAIGDFDTDQTNAIPSGLRGWFTAEPLWIELRWARDEQHVLPATFHVDGIPLRGTAQWTEGGLQLFDVPKQNDPKVQAAHFQALDAYAESGNPNPNVSVTIHTRFDEARARLSWIRSAYLAAFAALGWSYIFREVMDPFREQLKQPDAQIIPTYILRNPAASPGERRMLLVDQPDELRCVAVMLGEHTVFLPGSSAR